jgi:CRISPR system Cascade subunit CasA
VSNVKQAIMHDLLDDPLIGVTTVVGARAELTLPAVLAALGRDDVESFTGLQAHQEHAWHAFLTQLGAIALHASQRPEATTESDWRQLLLALTGDRVEPWSLVVADLSQPAFMQPPVPEASLDDFKGPLTTPDEIDVLVTTKNHDVKLSRIAQARPEHWLFALVTLQTMQGFLGPGNYGIARMNGGPASRPGVGLTPSRRVGARWKRDLPVLLHSRKDLCELGLARHGGMGLLWLEPWDGATTLAFGSLDPYFIEVCRRVRLVLKGLIPTCVYAPTDVPRIAAGDLNGVTGDPWTPVVKKAAKALTVSESGFNYRLTSRLLLGGDYAPGIALRPFATDGDTMRFIASVLVRGFGRTEGLHQREVTIPLPIWRLMGREDERNRLANLARTRVDRTALVANEVLKPALLCLLQAAPAKIKLKDPRVGPFLKRFDQQVDDVFFSALWEAAEASAEEADRRWDRQLVSLARAALEAAIHSTPLPGGRRYRAVAGAENRFATGLHRNLPELSPPVEERAV